MLQYMRPARAARLALLLAFPAAAQEPQLLVRDRVVRARTLAPVRELQAQAASGSARWQHADVYVYGKANIDASNGERLEPVAHQLCLHAADGTARWAMPDPTSTGGSRCHPNRRLLLRERVVAPRGLFGLVGIVRATGEICWQRDDLPNDILLADDQLVVATGSANGTPALAVFAAANGACCCRVELPEWPRHVAAGPHGVAVAFERSLHVYDRTGPLLFTAPVVGVSTLCAGTDGWFTSDTGSLQCWSRTGTLEWEVTKPRHARFLGRDLLLRGAPTGDLLVASPSERLVVQCLARRNGLPLWRIDLPIGDTSDRFDLRCAGEHLLVTTLGARCDGVVQVDARTGATLQQQEFEAPRAGGTAPR